MILVSQNVKKKEILFYPNPKSQILKLFIPVSSFSSINIRFAGFMIAFNVCVSPYFGSIYSAYCKVAIILEGM